MPNNDRPIHGCFNSFSFKCCFSHLEYSQNSVTLYFFSTVFHTYHTFVFNLAVSVLVILYVPCLHNLDAGYFVNIVSWRYNHMEIKLIETTCFRGHFMKLVITDNLSFTDYYHGNSPSQPIKIKNVTVPVSEWQFVSDDKFHEIPPRCRKFHFFLFCIV